MPTGIVVSFVPGKHGFIKPDDGGPDLFVNVKDLERDVLEELRPGMRVRYRVVDLRHGLVKAGDIVIVGR